MHGFALNFVHKICDQNIIDIQVQRHVARPRKKHCHTVLKYLVRNKTQHVKNITYQQKKQKEEEAAESQMRVKLNS